MAVALRSARSGVRVLAHPGSRPRFHQEAVFFAVGTRSLRRGLGPRDCRSCTGGRRV